MKPTHRTPVSQEVATMIVLLSQAAENHGKGSLYALLAYIDYFLPGISQAGRDLNILFAAPQPVHQYCCHEPIRVFPHCRSPYFELQDHYSHEWRALSMSAEK
ncbi:unnamed protein product [Blepharisma stoltei]|uniref:Uncharacterized protein n=1 Tax=Blepharisma stoltei TaxID=1481888 RepID=A0AAU9J7W6_9CILI|nr:unnamed protein product [Blepharisma stoltei]